jgi:phage terminase large subunit GpA-like protein
MLQGAVWRPTASGDGQTAGFHLPGWYAPAGWTSWEQIRDEFLRAKEDPLLLKGWVNKRAAEAWEDEAVARVNADGLMARVAEDNYQPGIVPDGALLLLMAVDTQDTWLETTVWGFGEGEECWRIWHQKVEGDPAGDEVWRQIDTIRRTVWPRADGGEMTVKHCAVDTGGHFTHEAYEYCRRNAGEGVVAIKGATNRSAPALGKGSKVDVNYRGKVIKNGVTLYMVGGHTLKRTIYARLKKEAPGAGAIHFDMGTDEVYLKGLTAERLIPRMVKGFQVLEWHNPAGARNEPLDILVYCLAMLELVKRRYNRATMWQQLAAQINHARENKGAPSMGRLSASGRFGG